MLRERQSDGDDAAVRSFLLLGTERQQENERCPPMPLRNVGLQLLGERLSAQIAQIAVLHQQLSIQASFHHQHLQHLARLSMYTESPDRSIVCTMISAACLRLSRPYAPPGKQLAGPTAQQLVAPRPSVITQLSPLSPAVSDDSDPECASPTGGVLGSSSGGGGAPGIGPSCFKSFACRREEDSEKSGCHGIED